MSNAALENIIVKHCKQIKMTFTEAIYAQNKHDYRLSIGKYRLGVQHVLLLYKTMTCIAYYGMKINKSAGIYLLGNKNDRLDWFLRLLDDIADSARKQVQLIVQLLFIRNSGSNHDDKNYIEQQNRDGDNNSIADNMPATLVSFKRNSLDSRIDALSYPVSCSNQKPVDYLISIISNMKVNKKFIENRHLPPNDRVILYCTDSEMLNYIVRLVLEIMYREFNGLCEQYYFSHAQLLSKYIGEPEKRFDSTLRRVKTEYLFVMENFENLGSKRTWNEEDYLLTIKNLFLKHLDDFTKKKPPQKYFMLFTTTEPIKNIDSGLLRRCTRLEIQPLEKPEDYELMIRFYQNMFRINLCGIQESSRIMSAEKNLWVKWNQPLDKHHLNPVR